MVLDGKRASSSFAAYGIKLTREYVVIISADGIDEYCSKLTRFTNHDVKAVLPSTIFWEEGKELVVEDDSSFSVVEEHQSKNYQILIRTFLSGSQRQSCHIGLTKRSSTTTELFMPQNMNVMSIILISTKKNLKSILVLTFLAVMQRCFVLLIILCKINI